MKRRKLTSRERILAILCVVVAGIMFARFGVLNPRKGIRGNLDREIEEKEAKLLMLTEAKQLAESVDKDYDRYRQMMSDERTEEEVRNNLQQEIYVLASKAGVTVPTIKQGSTDSFAYYKRYLVAVAIQGKPGQVADFMALLEKSPMLLHVEKLTIERRGDNKVGGDLTVSRSLVASAEHDMPASEDEQVTGAAAAPLSSVSVSPAPANMVFNGGFEEWDERDQPNAWRLQYVEVEHDPDRKVDGTVAGMFKSLRGGAYVSQDVVLKCGTTYTWSANAAVRSGGPVSMFIVKGRRRGYLGRKEAVQELSGSDMRYYEQRFTTAGELGSTCSVRLQLSFGRAGTLVCLDNVSIFEGAGV